MPFFCENKNLNLLDSLSEKLNKKLLIKNKEIKNRLSLAPMAALTHIAFRECVDNFKGCGLMFTEMCSAKALPHENPEFSEFFRWRKEELDFLSCQIFGGEVKSLVKAAERIEEEGFFGVDLNFACSAAAICKQGAGAALLKDPDKAVEIVSSIRRSISIALSVKFRTGWEDRGDKAAKLAERFEKAGCDFISFHPRVAPDRRTRPPRMEHIKTVKESVSIPVFGNGNIFCVEDALKMLEETGCDGLSIGRMALARPWIFAYFTKKLEKVPKHGQLLEDMLLSYCSHFGDLRGLKLFKKFLPYAMSIYSFGHSMQARLRKADTKEESLAMIREVFKKEIKSTIRPNGNLIS